MAGPNTHQSLANIRWFTTMFPSVHPALVESETTESSSR